MTLQRNKKTKLVDTIVLILLILGAVAMVFPLVYMVFSSF